MFLKVLGCSGGIGAGLRTTSLLINEQFLIDCGTGVGDLTLEEMSKIRHVFLTHSHLDHIACLPLLLDSIFDSLQRNPITLHAEPETMQALCEHIFNWKIWPDFFELPNNEHPVVTYEPMEPGDSLLIDACRFEMIQVNHGMPAVGYQVESDSHAVAFSGDTTINDAFWAALNARPVLDHLLVECAFADEDYALSRDAKHYCPQMLADDLKKLRHHPEIHISHLKPGAEERIMRQLLAHLPDYSVKQLQPGEFVSV